MEAATTEVRTLPPLAGESARSRFRTAHAVQIIGGFALLGLVAGTLLVVVAAGQGSSSLSTAIKLRSPGWLTWPFHGLWHGRTNDHFDIQIAFLLVVLAMFVLYLVAIWLARRIAPPLVWGAVVAVHVICFLSPPLLLTDVFNYIGYARMGVLHHLNPYTHLPLDIAGDPIFHLDNWHHLPSPYGPLFTLGTYLLVPLGIAGAYWVYKFAVMLAALGCLWLVSRICRRLGVQPLPAVVLVGLNPLVVLYGTAGQHNDWFQMLFLLGSIYLGLRAREELGAAAMVGAAALKASAAALVPIAALGSGNRRRTIAGAIAGAVVFGALSLAAFGPHLPAIGIQSKLVTPFSIPNIAGIFFGRGGEDSAVRVAFEGLFVLGAIACTVLAFRRREPILALGWLSLLSLVTIGWDMPWYILWLLPFLAFARNRFFRVAALCVILWVSVQWTPQVSQWAHNLGFNPAHQLEWKKNSRYTARYLR